MANLENLTLKIIKDAEEKAKSIIAEAKKEENTIINQSIQNAQKEKELIISKANMETLSKGERTISNAKLLVRNNILGAKQKVIQSVFSKACMELEKVSQDKYDEFVKSYIRALDIQGDEEIIVGTNSKHEITQELVNGINSYLTSNGKKGEVKLGVKRDDIKEGFILYNRGIEINCTFENLVDSYRDELQSQVISVLFG